MDENGRDYGPSRWLIRAMEWDEPRARYPNLWHDGMPRRLMMNRRAASRLRLGDIVATYYPHSRRHPDRAESCVGISRVSTLTAEDPGHAWVWLETEFRFAPPLKLERQPRFVLMCCDPGWPDGDSAIFDAIVAAAVERGYRPAAPGVGGVHARPLHRPSPPAPPSEPRRAVVETPLEPGKSAKLRRFAGADYSGDMRDPRRATWLAIVELFGDALHILRLQPTGRHGLQRALRSPDRELMDVEAIGLDFPFGLPKPFAESLVGRPLEPGDWWHVAQRMEHLTRPAYLIALEEFRNEAGELKRLTDERCRACSPLHRVNPDLGPMTYHGMRMIGEDRSRYALRPFETALGRLLLEVYPGAVVRDLDLGGARGKKRIPAIVAALETHAELPVTFDEATRSSCLGCRDALDAVIAARAAAAAVMRGEVDRTPEELAPGHGEQVRLEGWIYGLGA